MVSTADYKFTNDFQVTDEVKQAFEENGFIILRNLLDYEEITKLKAALEGDEGVMKKAYFINDGEKTSTKMCLWNHPGKDITGMVGRCEKVATTMEKLLGGEVYHYHTKLMMKEAQGGGKFVWHQDYGYWYDNGCIFPDMGTVFIAVDKCAKHNGCLQVIPGSHKLGRIDHKAVGGQRGADMERMEYVMQQIKPEFVELGQGDALFFHCNVLHTSADNLSQDRRWAFLVAYNRASNNPVKKHHHPRYVKLEKVSNDAIRECTAITDIRNKGFFIQKSENYSENIVEDEHLN